MIHGFRIVKGVTEAVIQESGSEEISAQRVKHECYMQLPIGRSILLSIHSHYHHFQRAAVTKRRF